jgi:lysyl-tRNA synthetase class 2
LPAEPSAFHPSAALSALRARAEIVADIRTFFRERGVLETETPLLCAAGAVDEHLDPIPVTCRLPGAPSPVLRYLVTSPEHSMKRLLAAGSGPIYQITRAFRDNERGRLHNPEFTILEWYRPGFDHLALMDEVEALVERVLAMGLRWVKTHATGAETGGHPAGAAPTRFARTTYRAAFAKAIGLDPFEAPADRLAAAVSGSTVSSETPRDEILNLLLVERVEPTLGFDRPTFLLDYPASQAALARVRPEDPPVAERFELYVRGVELANGYHELLDPLEQARRFREANDARRRAGKPELPIDARFLEALRQGMPPCAGVALGLDRLIMLALGGTTIDAVVTFPFERA